LDLSTCDAYAAGLPSMTMPSIIKTLMTAIELEAFTKPTANNSNSIVGINHLQNIY
jgi:hypothetical protein